MSLLILMEIPLLIIDLNKFTYCNKYYNNIIETIRHFHSFDKGIIKYS